MQNLSHENEFDLHELVRKTDFHVNGFALGLVLKQRPRELGNGLFTAMCYTDILSHTYLTDVHCFSRCTIIILYITELTECVSIKQESDYCSREYHVPLFFFICCTLASQF